MRIFIMIFFIVLANTISTSTAQAKWPILLIPSVSFLSSHHYIDTSHCPPGQGRVHAGTIIELRDLCKTYCPAGWRWKIKSSDEICHDLEHGFILRDATIIYHPDDDGDEGHVQYSEVNAYYGDKNSNHWHTALHFETTKEHWSCTKVSEGSDALICANDI